MAHLRGAGTDLSVSQIRETAAWRWAWLSGALFVLTFGHHLARGASSNTSNSVAFGAWRVAAGFNSACSDKGSWNDFSASALALGINANISSVSGNDNFKY
jgi:hypothetical protein